MMIRTNAIAVLICCAAFCAAPARAADGEILINQAAVNTGGITPGDTAGFPALINRPGRYKLTGNLRVPANFDGIEVHASDVTIDLNGFTISSDPPGEARGGVFVRDADRVRIANGTITGFRAWGVYLAEGEFDVVENMRILSTSGFSHAAIYSGRQARIRNNTIANNTFNIVNCAGCLIEQNVITGSAFYGIGIRGGQAVNNVIVGNSGHGLSVSQPPDKTGYGGNILVGNNGGGQQVNGGYQLHPNVCSPDCP